MAFVSGSTKGIGFAIATGLAREGARVIVNGRSEKAVTEAKEQIRQTGLALILWTPSVHNQRREVPHGPAATEFHAGV
jgi:NAD(P)-dependent dehydrogenase (short-subunit alcohol dehydrogenase family)